MGRDRTGSKAYGPGRAKLQTKFYPKFALKQVIMRKVIDVIILTFV